MKAPYVVLARKHRPQAFEDVVGQDAVTVTLQNALKGKRTAHAYLFTGPRGIGKTTTARLLAKALNCKEGPTPEPCGKCPSCVEIASSSSIDVLEMDAASNTGVDNVRESIIETVALVPSRDRYKVFIIDEAHMLSTAAFNALLKTLEEPPPHVVFILATTESSKIPATIASRCQRHKFRPVSLEALSAHLSGVAKKEKIAIDADALELLSRSAAGSLRDAVGILDQCHTFHEGKITAQAVREMFGFVAADMLKGVAEALARRNAQALGEWLSRADAEGIEPAQLLRDLRDALEPVYMGLLGAGAVPEAWAGFSSLTSASGVGFILRRISKTLEELRQSDSPRLSLELGLFGCLEAAQDLGAWVERLERLEQHLSEGGEPAPAAPAPAAPGGGKSREAWARVLADFEDAPALCATLRQARLDAEQEDRWRLVFSREFELKTAQRSLAAIEAKLATALGRPVALKLEVGTVGEPDLVVEAEAAEAEGATPASPLQKAEKILGGTVKFIKKK